MSTEIKEPTQSNDLLESRASLNQALRDQFPATYEAYYDFGGIIIKVICNQESLVEYLNDYFTGFGTSNKNAIITVYGLQAPEQVFDVSFKVKPADPGKTKIKEESYDMPDGRIVRKRLTGMHFIFGDGDNVAIGDCYENSNQLVNFINNRLIEYLLNTGGVLGHAAGVCKNGKGLGIAGFSGMGKSSLSLRIMQEGTDFVSNDRLIVFPGEKSALMYGVPKMPRINPGTIISNRNLKGIMTDEEVEEVLELPDEELWDLEQKYDADVTKCFEGCKFELKSQMQYLLLLNWKRNEEPCQIEKINILKNKDLLYAFIKQTGLFFMPDEDVPQDRSFDEYIETLKNTEIYEASGGVDFDYASDFCMSLLSD